MTQTASPQAICLKDYQPSPFSVREIHLEVKLFEHEAVVTCELNIHREDTSAKTLILNGESLDLQSVVLNGKTLEPNAYQQSDNELSIPVDENDFTVKTTVTFDPKKNTTCTGLYRSKSTYCTQCESHGFRRIAYSMDRPDVMSVFTTRIEADKKHFPDLLSNGNPIEKGDLPDGRHFVTWHDPFKKPAHLFALVAGDMHCHRDTFITQSGRQIDLQLYVEKHNADKTDHAMHSLKESMDWDEKNYGLEYDLDIYMIVAVSDFNMGAMENKGLNIFNDKYVLANPQTATDTDYQNILQVIGHEYFHNWSGNRVSLRDWFQLSLKEGFTVFRDQCFGADKSSAAIRRIEDVRALKTSQFAEDASPMSHPVRPDSYIEMNNFYTVTVYEKGAELIRMQYTLLGPETFRKATDEYFKRFDGQAVTTDDFVDVMQEVSGIDLTQFRLWYSQSGTPVLDIDWDYDSQKSTLSMTFKQHTPPTADQKTKQPLHIPVRLALLNKAGEHIHPETVLSIQEVEQTIVFKDVKEKPIPSLLRGFSAPVKAKITYSPEELLFLATNDDDPVARYEALQQLYVNEILHMIVEPENKWVFPERIKALFAAFLNDSTSDPALLALLMTLPSENYLAEQIKPVPVDAIHRARQFLIKQIAETFHHNFLQHYLAFKQDHYELTQLAVAKRAFQHRCLGYITATQAHEALELAVEHYHQADNMTDRLAGLQALNDIDCEQRDACLTDFYETWSQDHLVIDKWLALQATARCPGVTEHVEQLSKHEAFSFSNPNKVYSLFLQFGINNPYYFHQSDGAGYRLLTDAVIRLNEANPQVAARLVKPLINFRHYDDNRQALMKEALVRIQGEQKLSKDIYEIVMKSLE